MLAKSTTCVGEHLYLVECKQYAPERPVGVEIVRSLYGVVEEKKATAGLVITTSHFTKGAMAFRDKLSHRMSLKKFQELLQWLRQK